jgi:oligopeptidase B
MNKEKQESRPKPPVADVRPVELKSPHGTRVDDYYWLRDDQRKDPEVLAYLRAENAYKDAMLARVKPLQEQLYDEIIGRIKKDDSTVPYRDRGYYYYRRYETDGEYPIYARKQGPVDQPEEILRGGNQLAAGHDFYQIANYEVSQHGSLLAWADDTTGRRLYTIHFKDLATGRILPDTITGNESDLVWADDDETLFYIERDPVTLQGMRVKRHRLGTDSADDPVVYELDDKSFHMSLGRTGDDRYIVLHMGSKITDEVRFLPADQAEGEFQVLLPRETNHEYDVEHIDDRWIIRSNWRAKNFRLMQATDDQAHDRANWLELVPYDEQVYTGQFDVFNEHLVVAERREGLRSLRVLDRDGKQVFTVDADDPAYAMAIDVNAEQNTEWLRYRYSSLTTPDTIYEINMQTRERRLLKQEPVLGGFDADNYQAERLWAPARDGTQIPVSLVYRKGFEKDGAAPLYQYGYGSYGYAMDPDFEDEILSLIDRGFVYAMAHIRGGQEMGRAWYEGGKMLNKMNTFTDFIDVTEYLIDQGYAAADKVVASGGSAGGLLVGAVANLRPDLYRAIVADVPFVDVVTTMLDEDIPLTTNEYVEWGDPRDKEYYDYMLAYSPYDNVTAQDYPAMLVTTGLWDGQVQYFEPAKWVAKLRATKTDDNRLLFHINMDAGHGGQSGRFRRNRELAMEYAFILDELGMAD